MWLLRIIHIGEVHARRVRRLPTGNHHLLVVEARCLFPVHRKIIICEAQCRRFEITLLFVLFLRAIRIRAIVVARSSLVVVIVCFRVWTWFGAHVFLARMLEFQQFRIGTANNTDLLLSGLRPLLLSNSLIRSLLLSVAGTSLQLLMSLLHLGGGIGVLERARWLHRLKFQFVDYILIEVFLLLCYLLARFTF